MKMIFGFMFDKRVHAKLKDNVNHFSKNYKLFLLNIKRISLEYKDSIFIIEPIS